MHNLLMVMAPMQLNQLKEPVKVQVTLTRKDYFFQEAADQVVASFKVPVLVGVPCPWLLMEISLFPQEPFCLRLEVRVVQIKAHFTGEEVALEEVFIFPEKIYSTKE